MDSSSIRPLYIQDMAFKFSKLVENINKYQEGLASITCTNYVHKAVIVLFHSSVTGRRWKTKWRFEAGATKANKLVLLSMMRKTTTSSGKIVSFTYILIHTLTLHIIVSPSQTNIIYLNPKKYLSMDKSWVSHKHKSHRPPELCLISLFKSEKQYILLSIQEKEEMQSKVPSGCKSVSKWLPLSAAVWRRHHLLPSAPTFVAQETAAVWNEKRQLTWCFRKWERGLKLKIIWRGR